MSEASPNKPGVQGLPRALEALRYNVNGGISCILDISGGFKFDIETIIIPPTYEVCGGI